MREGRQSTVYTVRSRAGTADLYWVQNGRITAIETGGIW